MSSEWRNETIDDDPVRGTNSSGTLTFATSGPDSRTTQMFINLGNNASLDAQGFSPFGTVRDMTPVDAINNEYGEEPVQGEIQSDGNSYLRDEFPNLDYIVSARVL